MSSLSTTLRLLTPKLPQNPNPNPKPFHSFHKTLIFRRPISFDRLSPSSSSHSQQQQSNEDITNLLPPSLREIVSLFQSVGDDPKSKYQQLLHYGSQLPALDSCYKNNDHRVRGCVSQVWIRAFPDSDDSSNVRFEADSDSALTKGLAAVLVFGLSGSPVSVITRVPPEFVFLLGLRQSLTPSRNNGFLNMLMLMQKKARELQCLGEDDEQKDLGMNVNGWRPLDYAESKKRIDVSSALEEKLDAAIDGDLRVNDEYGDGDHPSLSAESKKEIDVSSSFLKEKDVEFVIDDDLRVNDEYVDGGVGGTRGERIKRVLESALTPVELDVEDVSHLHAGHAGVGGSIGGETHFNVRVVSKEFEGKSLVKRHRLVYDLLRDELQSGLHSLSIVAKTPSEIEGDV